METPGALVVARVPSVIVPVCVVKGVSETPCAKETPRMEETPCVSGVVASVPESVLPSTPCVKGAPQAEEAACAVETARVCEQPCVSETPWVSAPTCVGSVVCVSEARRVSERLSVRKAACVRSLCVREMSVAMREHAAVSPRVNGMVRCSLGIVTRRCAWIAWRRRLRQWRDKSRVAAVVAIGTVPGLHGGERLVRAVQRTRPPRARLRE